MELTRENLNNLFFGIQGNLNKGLGQTWTGWEKFAVTVNSSTLMEKYPMTIITGAMREWLGERVVNELKGKLLTVLNRDFERTEGVNRNDLEDDTFSFFAPLFEAIGVEAGNLWGRLATDALVDPGKWADDKAFYGERKIGKAAINNLVEGALTAANYETARARMMQFTDADGKTPLGLIPNLLVVGTQMEGTAKRIFKTDLIVENGGTVSNIHKDEVEILLDPFLTGNDWYLLCTNRGIRPIAVQKRKVGALVRWDQEHDECVKRFNRCEYGLHYRGAAAGIAPHLVIKGQSA